MMKDAPQQGRVPLVWMDVTTSWRARSAQTSGTLRVEGKYAVALSQVMGPQLRFCRYRRTRKRFLPNATFSKSESARSAWPERSLERPRNLAGASLRDMGRNFERGFRRLWGDGLSGVFQKLDARTGTAPFAEARSGDVLLLAGENWTQYDFDLLRRIRDEQQVRLAVVCQDMIPVKCPQFFESEAFVERFRFYADFLVGNVDLLVAISNSTKADLVDYAQRRGGIHGRLETISLGADFDSRAMPERPAELPDLAPGEFVVSISTLQSRKNFDLLYRLWRRLSEQSTPGLPKLIIVGRKGFGTADLLWQISHDPLVQQSIKVLHQVSDNELSWLYRNCLWTLYPSFYEGWGLPISESLAHGKYCLASNAASLPEVGQGLVKHLDPLDFRAWQEAVNELIRAPEVLIELEKRIATSYRAVTWLQSAEHLAAKLRELLAQPPRLGEVLR